MRHPGVYTLALGLCLCLLYSGYELARASSLALFSRIDGSAQGVSGACSATLSFILSIASLGLYGHGAEVLGAKWTLLFSAGACCATFLGFAWASSESHTSWVVVSALYAFRETYVALIGTQVWSLLSSALKERGSRESRRWFCIIQGASCIFSALAGVTAGRLATAGGQVYLLLATALSLGITVVTVALTPVPTLGGSKGGWEGGKGDHGKTADKKGGGLFSVLRSSVTLFRRSPLLSALLIEAMVYQVLTATLNMSFNEAIRHSLVPGQASGETGGARAAGFVGNSFAIIGLLSGILQLLVMPWAMILVNPTLLLKSLSLVAGSGFLVTFVVPGFRTATAAFAITKVLEYSVRGTALELVYQPLGDEERLLGKEAIATVGVRIGRTAAHVALYLCSAALGGVPPQRVLMGIALASAAVWVVSLQKVEEFARQSKDPMPLPTPQPLPSKQKEVAGRLSAELGVDGDVSASRWTRSEGVAGAGELRRRNVKGGVDTSAPAASNGGPASNESDEVVRKDF